MMHTMIRPWENGLNFVGAFVAAQFQKTDKRYTPLIAA